MQNLSGTLIENYRLEELFFEDGPVQAYRGVHTGLKRERAVYLIQHTDRELPPDVYMAELTQNAQAAARLDSHLGLVKVHDVGVMEDVSYFTTDLLPDPTLAQLLERVERNRRHLALPDVLDVSDRMARAMEHAYVKGGLFVSLQPTGIKFRPDPEGTSPSGYLPVLTDIGITANQSGRFQGHLPQSGEMIREFGFFIFALLTNLTSYHPDQPLDFNKLTEATEEWPVAQADRMRQLVQQWVQEPVADFSAAMEQVLLALKQFSSLDTPPKQVSLREIYEYLVEPVPPPPEPVDPPVSTPVEPETGGEPAPMSPAQIQVIGLDNQITSYPLGTVAMTVGRSEQCDITLADPRASRKHLQIEPQGVQVMVTDLLSLNGTFLDNQRIPAQTHIPWNPGQAVRIGGTQLLLQSGLADVLQVPVVAPLPEIRQQAHSPESLAIPSSVHIMALGQEIPISAFTMLPENRLIGFYVPINSPYSVEPGAVETIPVYVVNFGRVPVNLSLKADNVPPAWVTISQPEFSLRSGEQREMEVVLKPQAHHMSKAGNYRLKISLTDIGKPSEENQSRASRSIPIRVKSYTDFVCTVEGEQVGSELTISVLIINRGNGQETFVIYPRSDFDDGLNYEPLITNLTIESGQQAQAEIQVSLKKQALFGATKQHQISVQITGAQGDKTKPVVFTEKSRLGFG